MATEGFAGFYIETRDYDASKRFWQGLGFSAVFETDHGSGQFVHPNGGPYVFLAERNTRQALKTHAILSVADAERSPLGGMDVRQPYTAQHWDVLEAIVRDPDGRDVSLHAPLPPGASAPDAESHHAATYGSAKKNVAAKGKKTATKPTLPRATSASRGRATSRSRGAAPR